MSTKDENEIKIEVEEDTIVPERPDYEAELIAILKSSASDDAIRELLNDYHDNDIAEILDDLSAKERVKLFRILGDEAISDVFAYLDEDVAKEIISELGIDQAVNILESMDADEAVDILEELEDDKRNELINLLDEESKQDIRMISSYDDDEIGSKMTTNYIVIGRGLSIRQAMKSLVDQAADNDNIGTIYVVEDDETFYGAIDLKDLIVARTHTNLEDLISTSYPYVYAHEDIAECLEEIKDYSEDSIPVLDNDKKLIGVITAQDVIEVVDEEMGEDYAKLAGLIGEEDLKEPLLESMKKRLPWLLILFVLGLVVSSVIGIFEGVVAQLTVVIAFQSLILDMAGNVGTQSLAVTIRVLVDENLTFKNKAKLVFKEMRVGFTNGILLGILAFVGTGLYIHIAKGFAVHQSFAISMCIGISLLVAMIISSLMGTLIPLFFNKIKVDPAVASGPLITTVNDLVAVVSYYGLTWILLINLMQITG
ncbi:magnesium transporter [Eubacterium oxidoreducens]|uniref:Magnesium transporter MgtE n=1 Tax=Eubacterium oxidoreducens TaxID=1732 RepID=A0A1G6ABW7_EUBOX|nr:magnesium transporter [Eubacterium oxidoreducens]SDB05901.1 magnesium transporter [Eubacterium oxidoreducens]